MIKNFAGNETKSTASGPRPSAVASSAKAGMSVKSGTNLFKHFLAFSSPSNHPLIIGTTSRWETMDLIAEAVARKPPLRTILTKPRAFPMWVTWGTCLSYIMIYSEVKNKIFFHAKWIKILPDQQTKLVKVGGDTVRHEAKLSDATIELDRPAMDNNLCHRLQESIQISFSWFLFFTDPIRSKLITLFIFKGTCQMGTAGQGLPCSV